MWLENERLIKDPIRVAATMNDYVSYITRTIGEKGPQSNHETIALTGIITSEEIPFYVLATQLAGGVSLKKLEYFAVMLNIFES